MVEFYVKPILIMKNKYFILLSSLVVVWMLFGVFPLICYEGDSMHIINGVTIMYNSGTWELPPTCSYQYDMQPLVTITLLCLKKCLSFLSVEQIYCLISALSAIVFFMMSLAFVKKITNMDWGLLLIAILLIPESFAIAMYPNSSILAAVLFIIGLTLLLDRKIIPSIMLLGIAPLFRMDIMVVYPAIFGILCYNGQESITYINKLKKPLFTSILIGVVAVSITTVGCYLLAANPIKSIFDLKSQTENERYQAVVPFTILSFYTLVNVVLLPWGIYKSFKKKKYVILLVGLVPILLIHWIYRGQGTATKHFMYLIPFVILFTAPVIKDILNGSRGIVLRSLFIAVVVLYNVISIRADMPLKTKQWMNEDWSSSKLGPIYHLIGENKTNFKIQLGLGAGQLIPTADEYMLFSGNIVYPLFINNYKYTKKDSIDAIINFFEKPGEYYILSGSWEGHSSFANRWLNKGYSFKRVELGGKFASDIYILSDNMHKYTLHEELLYENKTKFKERIERLSKEHDKLYVVTLHENETLLLNQLEGEGVVKKVMSNLYIAER